MKPLQKISIILFSFIVPIFMFFNIALAGLVPCGRSCLEWNQDGSQCVSAPAGVSLGEAQPCTLCDLWHLASNIVHFLIFYVSVPLAILAFVIAGVIYMTSGGSDTRVGLAHTIFRNALIGIIVVFCAWLIVDTLIKTIAVNFESVVWSWNDFPPSCESVSGGSH